MPALAVADGTRLYANLKAEATAAGIFERSRSFYAAMVLFAFAGYAASVVAIYAIDGYALLFLACLSFSFFSVQSAGLMHDSGHRAVFSSIRGNDILGYAAAALLGMVFDNWKTRHNMHHAHPNEEDADPDMEIPFIATDVDLYRRKSALQRWLIRYQAFYYYPLGSIVSFSNRLGTITFFLRNPSLRHWWKFGLYVLGFALLFVVPFVVFPLAKAVFVFLTVHVVTGIYLANCFAPNHKGMPHIEAGLKYSFIEQQVITSRNVTGGLVTDTVLVGLNYQVEHHLFPYTPRNKLKLLRPLVQRVCRDNGIDYTEVGLLETNRILIRELAGVAREARLAPATAGLAVADSGAD